MLKSKSIKILCSIVLTINIVCLSLFTGTSFSVSQEKLSGYLVEKLSTMDSDDKLPVTIFLNEMDDSDMRSGILKKYGKDSNVYENEDRFYKEVVPNIKVDNKTIKSLVGDDLISPSSFKLENRSSKLNKELLKEINLEITKEMNEYVSNMRTVRSDMIKEYVGDFTKIFDSETIVFSSEYIEMIIVELSKSQILEISNNPIVESVHYSELDGSGVEAWNAAQVVGGDSTTGLSSSNFNNGEGYDGTGVVIGIIEHDGGKYDEDNYCLAEAHDSGRLSFVPTPGVAEAEVSDHATTVTSIICGKKVTIGGHTYEGLATGATVVQTAIHEHDEFYAAMELLIARGVNIVNLSARLSTLSEYTAYDKAVDKYVQDERIVFVKSAGNSYGYVTSPGKAYNAITVGNLATKSSNIALSSPYNLRASTSYMELSVLTNKPDVVAPGTDIHIPVSPMVENNMGSGTSYSAPVVAGIAAQLMTDETIYLLNPNALKNIIICGASGELVADTTVSYGELMDKSGAGLVNAVNSLAAKGNEWFEVIPYTYTDTEYRTVEDIYIKKGETIRIVLTYYKEEDIYITEEYGNNLDVRLVQTAGYALHDLSESTKNNVEVIEFKATSSGTYNLQVRLLESILNETTNPNLHYCITWRIF